MTDLHTHILPGIDDGARTVEESIALLRLEQQQGVNTVVLTPHFYRGQERPKHFLKRRQEAEARLLEGLQKLPAKEQVGLPKILLGAEVAFSPNLFEWEELPELCIGHTKNLLLELPFTPWTGRMINQMYDLISHTGITPVIAHLERYIKSQRPSMIQEVLNLGVPVQITGEAFLHWFDRRSALSLMQKRGDWLVASDCHGLDDSPPVIRSATDILEKKLGKQRVSEMLSLADKLAGV